MNFDTWKEKPIAELAKVIVSPVDKKSYPNEKKVYLCNYMDVYYNRFITNDIRFMEATASDSEIGKFSLKKGDVVITKDSEDPKDIAVPSVITENIEGLVCGYHLAILRPKKDTDSFFLAYAITHPRIRYDFYRYANGITRFGLTNDTYNKVKILIPNMVEQKAIASLLSVWDEAIEKTKRLIEKTEIYFNYLRNQLFANIINDKSTKAYRLSDVCSIIKGQQLNKADMNKNGKYYVLNGGIALSGNTDNWNTIENIISISEGGNSCGYVNFNKEKFWAGGHCYVVEQLSEIIIIDFLFHYLKSNQQKIMKLRVGSGLPNIQKKDIERFPIDVPDIIKQKQIAETLNFAQKEIELLKLSNEKYKTQKRGLMQKLLTGKWRIKVEKNMRFKL